MLAHTRTCRPIFHVANPRHGKPNRRTEDKKETKDKNVTPPPPPGGWAVLNPPIGLDPAVLAVVAGYLTLCDVTISYHVVLYVHTYVYHAQIFDH